MHWVPNVCGLDGHCGTSSYLQPSFSTTAFGTRAKCVPIPPGVFKSWMKWYIDQLLLFCVFQKTIQRVICSWACLKTKCRRVYTRVIVLLFLYWNFTHRKTSGGWNETKIPGKSGFLKVIECSSYQIVFSRLIREHRLCIMFLFWISYEHIQFQWQIVVPSTLTSTNEPNHNSIYMEFLVGDLEPAASCASTALPFQMSNDDSVV